MNKILLDTNCYTAYLAGDGDVLKGLRQAKATLMSIFVFGELYAGFKGGSHEKGKKYSPAKPVRPHLYGESNRYVSFDNQEIHRSDER